MNDRPAIYITEPEEVDRTVLTLLVPHYRLIEGDIGFWRHFEPTIEGLLIRSRTEITAAVLEQLPYIKHIIRVGVGLDRIDMAVCRQKGIKVFNAAGANADAVAEYVVGMMITALRRWQEMTKKDLRQWNRQKFMGRTLKDRIVGIIGFGAIGQKVFYKLSAWGVKEFVVYDPYLASERFWNLPVRFVTELDDLIEQAEVMTVHVPLTPETKYLVNRELIVKMKEDVVLINTARGGVVDEVAVIELLPHKRGVYVADVFEGEPQVRKELLESPQVIATPHIAAMTIEANKAMTREAITNFLEGKYVTHQ